MFKARSCCYVPPVLQAGPHGEARIVDGNSLLWCCNAWAASICLKSSEVLHTSHLLFLLMRLFPPSTILKGKDSEMRTDYLKL